MASDVDGEILAPEFKGYTLRITGGNDKQGFTMKQGILVNGRVRILMKGSKYPTTVSSCYLSFFLLIFNTILIIQFNYRNHSLQTKKNRREKEEIR